MSKVLIIKSMNVTPEAEIGERIAPLLKEGYRVISAQTAVVAVGEMKVDGYSVARHLYYTSTVVLDRPILDSATWRLPSKAS